MQLLWIEALRSYTIINYWSKTTNEKLTKDLIVELKTENTQYNIKLQKAKCTITDDVKFNTATASNINKIQEIGWLSDGKVTRHALLSPH